MSLKALSIELIYSLNEISKIHLPNLNKKTGLLDLDAKYNYFLLNELFLYFRTKCNFDILKMQRLDIS